MEGWTSMEGKGLDRPSRDVLATLEELIRTPLEDPFHLFDEALGFMVRHFEADHAVMTRLVEGHLDTFWWAHAGQDLTLAGGDLPEVHHALHLSKGILEVPEGIAVVPDLPGPAIPGLRAFAGVLLGERTHPFGTLGVIHAQPKLYLPTDVELLRALAGLLGRALEVETLKFELHRAQEALELTEAVVEDSALQSPQTGLPNARYLEVWLKARLPFARRHKEPMAVVRWNARGAVDAKAVRAVADSLRGEDLLVELRPGRYLILLPETPQNGASILLSRVRPRLGWPVMGATMWMPGQDDMALDSALRRAETALVQARTAGSPRIRWAPTIELAN